MFDKLHVALKLAIPPRLPESIQREAKPLWVTSHPLDLLSPWHDEASQHHDAMLLLRVRHREESTVLVSPPLEHVSNENVA
jgi:hypothetical protein